MKRSGLIPGFTYHCEILDKNGKLTEKFAVDNLIPIQGMQRVASLLLGSGASPTSDWYLGLLNTGFSVTTASTLQGACASENVAYTSAGDDRADCTLVYDDAYAISNSASVAEFVFADAATIYGAFITDIQTRAAYTSGVLLSVANFTTAKSIDAGGTLRLTAGLTLSNA